MREDRAWLDAARGPSERGGIATWLACAMCLGALAWWIVGLQRDVAAEGFATIETQRARIDAGAGWFDPRWEEELARRVAAFGPLSAGDRAGIARLSEQVGLLPFVASTQTPEVLWPDGLRIEVDLRAPVACVRTASESFLPVAPDGMLLSGEWRVPPACGWGFLPRIVLGAGPAELHPGDVLTGTAELDALAVAVSLWDHLRPEDVATLGRVVIDARTARKASVEEPGTRILMEGRRTILFGRSPASDEPGELPARLKWELVARALALLPGRAPDGEVVDWAQVDVRWDYGTLALRAAR
jgi:hypothetical protein